MKKLVVSAALVAAMFGGAVTTAVAQPYGWHGHHWRHHHWAWRHHHHHWRHW